MNVLLVNCRKLDWMQDSKGTIPVSLLHLAAVLRADEYTPIILDLSIKPRNLQVPLYESDMLILQDYVRSCSPAIVAFNCFVSQHFPFILEAASCIKNMSADIHVAIGGAHPTLFADQIMKNCENIDSVVLGEGEEQISALAGALAKGDLSLLDSTQAIAYRIQGRVVTNPRRSYLSDLDSLPSPAWDLITLQDYYSSYEGWHNPKNMNIQLSVPILTSRSCPFNCNFCACHKTMGRTFRMRSPNKIVDEMEFLCKEYGVNYFGFIDDNFNLNKQHVIGICDLIIKRKLNIQFEPTCGLYLGQVDEDIVNALARAGCVFARLPIEHGNEYMRNTVIGKNLSREQIFRAKKLLKDNGIRVSTMCIMGFPEDTIETLQDTYDMLIELDADLNYVFNLIPFPGSKVFEQAVREGLLLGHFDTTSLWRGKADLDPVQKEQQYYLRPRNMSFKDLDVFRDKFNQIRVMNPSLKSRC